jgi:hypothetical protein
MREVGEVEEGSVMVSIVDVEEDEEEDMVDTAISPRQEFERA